MPRLMSRVISTGGRALVLAFVLSGIVWLPACAPAGYESSPGADSYNDDVQYLAQFGVWENVSPYGMVWCPNAAASWRPFYYGHWIWSYDGWAWVSYEPFGWLVYHYGSWGYQPQIGWFWVPGSTWSAAPVEWYDAGDYAGWAPLPAVGFSWPDPWDQSGSDVWVVVPIERFTDEDVGKDAVTQPPREITSRTEVSRRAPDVKRIETVESRNLPTVKVRRREVDVRPLAPAAPDTAAAQPRKLERMDLPQEETRKVKKHTSDVERQVLTPRRDTTPPQAPPAARTVPRDTTMKKRIVR